MGVRCTNHQRYEVKNREKQRWIKTEIVTNNWKDRDSARKGGN